MLTIHELDGHAPELPGDGRYWVVPEAYVIGRVRLGQDVGIWFGAVLRGDNELIDVGAGSNIQDGAMLHTDLGFPLVIGAGSLIGLGAMILNGARIGAGCLVGANALVTEGKALPDGFLIVGAPAKAVRELTGAAAEGLRASASKYVANARRYGTGLKRLD